MSSRKANDPLRGRGGGGRSRGRVDVVAGPSGTGRGLDPVRGRGRARGRRGAIVPGRGQSTLDAFLRALPRAETESELSDSDSEQATVPTDQPVVPAPSPPAVASPVHSSPAVASPAFSSPARATRRSCRRREPTDQPGPAPSSLGSSPAVASPVFSSPATRRVPNPTREVIFPPSYFIFYFILIWFTVSEVVHCIGVCVYLHVRIYVIIHRQWRAHTALVSPMMSLMPFRQMRALEKFGDPRDRKRGGEGGHTET